MRKRILKYLLVLVLFTLFVYTTFKIFMDVYVKFPTYILCSRIEVISVSNDFVRLNKPTAISNTMFFPIKLNFGALQVVNEDGALVSVMTMNEEVVLKPKSITDVNFRISIPIETINEIIRTNNFDMKIYINGTISGSVYKIPFNRRLSSFHDISPNDELIIETLIPLINSVYLQLRR